MSNFLAQAAAEAAKREARKARETAEESLEASSNFVPFLALSQDSIKQEGLFVPSKQKLGKTGTWYAVKTSDISGLEEDMDDFGTKFTLVKLEDRCNIGLEFIRVSDTVPEVAAYINKFVKGDL